MTPRRELAVFSALLTAILALFLGRSLVGGMVLSPGDVVFASASFADGRGGSFEPSNRLLMDPVLQFAPWVEFNRAELRRGRLPLWNPKSGCGAPHLANGQSAVFDPFLIVASLGRLPDAWAWVAFSRLWVAGMGMYLLARSWKLGRWGRTFAGLAFPVSGFLVAWLLYPVASAAAWMPWLLLATDGVLDRPGWRRVGGLAIVVGGVLLGGHVQTSAHVLLSGGLYALWRWSGIKPSARWSLGIVLGIALASIEVIPLGFYLSRSPVWSDRRAETPPVLAVGRPRLLDAVCTALPYAFGSQRRGHPNVAKAVGVNNLNESAGGFAGLASLVWLAPLGWRKNRADRRARFLAFLTVFGALGAFGVPPVSNLLRIVPVLDVADNRRLTLWVAFGLVLLGGMGLDAIEDRSGSRAWRWWTRSWVVAAAGLVVAAGGLVALGPRLRAEAIGHYEAAASRTPGADPGEFRGRALRQARAASTILPAYYAIAAAHLIGLAGLAEALRRGRLAPDRARAALLALTLIDLFAFGFELNPSIPREDDRPDSAAIAYLKREAAPPARIVSVGAEMPPNLLMRYGLADCRNYDSVESGRSLAWFESMYEPEPDRPSHTSRRTITWSGIVRARERLRLAGVVAIVGASPPPEGVFDRVDRVGAVWIARLGSLAPRWTSREPGEIRVDLGDDRGEVRWVAETYDPGWRATIDGRPAEVRPYLGTFVSVEAPPGSRRLVFLYDPIEVRIASVVSLTALAAVAGMLLSRRRKPAPPSWIAPTRRVRIDLRDPRSPPALPSAEGRDADGPLHV